MKLLMISLFAAVVCCAGSDDQRAGAKLYARECAACHGRQREGLGKAPPLNAQVIGQTPTAELFEILRNGSLWRGMPSFAHLPEQQRRQIIAFLRSGPGPDSDSSLPRVRDAKKTAPDTAH